VCHFFYYYDGAGGVFYVDALGGVDSAGGGVAGVEAHGYFSPYNFDWVVEVDLGRVVAGFFYRPL